MKRILLTIILLTCILSINAQKIQMVWQDTNLITVITDTNARVFTRQNYFKGNYEDCLDTCYYYNIDTAKFNAVLREEKYFE